MVGFLERIQAKIEVLRLERRYTRRRDRRSTFVSNAVYVDGEYVYQTPNSTGSSSNTVSTAASQNRSSPSSTVNKMRNRMSMPAFGGSPSGSSRSRKW